MKWFDEISIAHKYKQKIICNILAIYLAHHELFYENYKLSSNIVKRKQKRHCFICNKSFSINEVYIKIFCYSQFKMKKSFQMKFHEQCFENLCEKTLTHELVCSRFNALEWRPETILPEDTIFN